MSDQTKAMEFHCTDCDTTAVMQAGINALKSDDIPHCKDCSSPMTRVQQAPSRAGTDKADDEIMKAINSYREDNPHTRMSR